jgi:hypothetical protein
VVCHGSVADRAAVDGVGADGVSFGTVSGKPAVAKRDRWAFAGAV